jgi:O-antigen/teichoic acid export membrane protein
LIGQLVNLATGTVGPMLLVGGYYKTALYLSITVLLVNSFLCVVLIPRFGITGAAVSNTSSIALLYLMTLLSVRLKMNLWPFDLRYVKGLVAVGIASILALAIKFGFNGFYVYNLVLQFAVIIIVFALTLLLLGLSHEDRAFIRIFLDRLGIKINIF